MNKASNLFSIDILVSISPKEYQNCNICNDASTHTTNAMMFTYYRWRFGPLTAALAKYFSLNLYVTAHVYYIKNLS